MSKIDEAIAIFEGKDFEGIDALVERRCIPEPNSGCLLWEGAVAGKGYPQYTFNVDGKPRAFKVTRAVLTKKLGQPPNETRHACDVKLCCNRDHLVDGSRKDNAIDFALRGWARRCGRKLSPSQALEIRRSGERPSKLMGRYGVSYQTVYAIKSKRIWAHLED